MKFKISIALFLAAFSLAANAKEEKLSQWSYSGKQGPGMWGRLDPAFKLCNSGKMQSPIDISMLDFSKTKPDLQLDVNYKNTFATILNNGHNLEVKVEEGSKIFFDKEEYALLEFHFHAPSEHLLTTKQFPLEVHFVHKNIKGDIAIVALFIEKGALNYELEKILLNLPHSINSTQKILHKINPLDLFPRAGGYYSYLGSLTTPPCTENVRWVVLSEPVAASLEQITKLTALYRDNSRPTQPLHGRKIETKLK